MTALFTLMPEAVGTISADSKPAIIEHLSGRFARVYALDEEQVRERIEEREKLGSTGFGAVWPSPMRACPIWCGRWRWCCGWNRR